MFRKFLLALPLALSTLTASAAEPDPVEPVKRVVAIAEKNFREPTNQEFVMTDYLSGAILKDNFSAAFIAEVEKGTKRAEETGDLFIDYDPVTGAQDSCPLKDINFINEGQKDGEFEIVMHFRSIYCLGDEFADEVDETRFRVVIEDGKPLIDDIINVFPDTDPISLRQVMDDYFQE